MDLLKAIEILELNDSYTENDVKQNYRRLIMKYHPDKCKEVNSSEKFIKIQEAYDFITSNKETDFFKTINNIFKNFVVDVPVFNKRQERIKLPITIKEYFTGIDKIVNIRKNCKCDANLCMNCVGSGYNIKEGIKSLGVCMDCIGDGYIRNCNCFDEIIVKLPKCFDISKQINFNISLEDNKYFFENGKIHYNFELSLKESLVGFEKTFKDPFDIEHLIVVKEPVKSGDGYSIIVNDCKLIIVFYVIYPKKLPLKLKKILNSFDF
jgi:hypothetical protein